MFCKKHLVLILLLISTITAPVFSKKKNPISVPTKVQEKINETPESPKSWYLCELKGKTKAGDVLCGPVETRELIILVWIANSCQPDKKYCIAKNKTYITKNPEKFFAEDFDKVKEDISTLGLAETYEKYFFTSYLSKAGQLTIRAEEMGSITMEDEELTDSEGSQYTRNVLMGGGGGAAPVEEETEQEEEAPLVQEPEPEPEPEPTPEPEAKPEPSPEQEPTPEPEPEPEPAPEPEPTPVPEPTPEPAPEPEPTPEPEPEPTPEPAPAVVEVTKPAFELPISTEPSVPLNRYQKENLMDYAPKKTPALPEDEDLSKYRSISTPNQKDSSGVTLLMKAAKAGNDWELKNLLASGADVNLKDNDGWTALMYAVRYQENTAIVEQLISAGCEVKVKNKYDISALSLAATYNGNPEILRKLLTYYSPSEKELLQAFTLMLSDNSSSEYSKSAKVDTFIEKSVTLNSFYNGKTPLMYAAQYSSSTAVIKKLLDYGASPSVRSADGKTAFDFAKNNPSLPHDEIYWALNKK